MQTCDIAKQKCQEIFIHTAYKNNKIRGQSLTVIDDKLVNEISLHRFTIQVSLWLTVTNFTHIIQRFAPQ